jgi:hypothetical protein
MHRRTAPVRWRAAWVLWTAHARGLASRARRARRQLASAALIVAGIGGLLGFSSLVGLWCLGLTGMAVSGGALWFGLMRDDGTGMPRRGERTVADVLEVERWRP